MRVHGTENDRETGFSVDDFGFAASAAEILPAPAQQPEEPRWNRWRPHCPRCGAALFEPVPDAAGPVACGKCANCTALLPTTHRIVVIGIGLWRGAILFVRRAVAPRRGLWSLPGGYMEAGELMPDALAREFVEEANVEIGTPRLIALYEMPQLNQLFAVHGADLRSGVAAPGSEAFAARLFPVDALPTGELAFPTDECVLRDLAEWKTAGGVKCGHFYWRGDGRIRLRTVNRTRPAVG